MLSKKCKNCDSVEIFKQGMCYTCFREYANKTLREWHKKNKEKYKEYEQNRIQNSKEKKCKQCGNNFKVYRNFLEFCSRDCAYKYWVENKTRAEKNNPSYRNGKYTKKYLKENSKTTGEHLSACRRYRTYFRKNNDYDYCERCGTSNSLKFETHHIVYASEAPKHKELHNFKNLIYVCIGCHNELHKHKILRNKLVEERGLNELFNRNLIIYEKKVINKTINSE
jgi:ribosomal protein S14